MANKDTNYSKKFRYDASQGEYVFQLKKRRWYWWLLLLLLLLPLFIRCERQIEVTTIDDATGDCVSGVEVTLQYTSHFLYKDGKFFCNEPVTRTGTTDADGKYTFEKLPCSVYSYIFYCLSRASYTSSDECYEQVPTPDESSVHYTRHKTLRMQHKVTDLTLTVVDRETHDPLASAKVDFTYHLGNMDVSASAETDAAGHCRLPGVPQCGEIHVGRASCYGYADTTDVDISVRAAMTNPADGTLELMPIKTRFTFFVKNKFTKEPIPEATVDVTLTSNGGRVTRGRTTTNVDGKGFGVYEDAFILADLKLHGSKTGYKDGDLDRPYTVEQFAALPDSQRVVYLEPLPTLQEFQNVDSLTHKPLRGVTNVVTIHSISGETRTVTEISNTNGKFTVEALPGDRLEIHSTLDPYYRPKDTVIPSFETGEVIPMQPLTTDLTFRTIDAETGEVLPHCMLTVSSSMTGAKTPTDSGDGTFVVHGLLMSETLSITASKKDYDTNSTTINNDLVYELAAAPQSRRDIPLDKQKSFSADIVMCIDCTGSMDRIINTIKSNAMNFYDDIKRKCQEQGKTVTDLRIRVIGFRDLDDSTMPPFETSSFYDIPAQNAQFRTFVSALVANGGGDSAEHGYNALNLAIHSPWNPSPAAHRVVLLWTDDESKDLRATSTGSQTLAALKGAWERDMDMYNKNMIIFAPAIPSWTNIEHGWLNTRRHDVRSGGGLSDLDYEAIIAEISKSI